MSRIYDSIYGDMFDYNRDGKIDINERAAEFEYMDSLFKEEEEDDDDLFGDDKDLFGDDLDDDDLDDDFDDDFDF